MSKLPKIENEEFDLWLRHFMGKNLNIEADLIFIDLFQNGSEFSTQQSLSERIKEYIKANPRRRKSVVSIIDCLLDFLVEKSVFREHDCRMERRKIFRKINRKTSCSNNKKQYS